VSIITNEGRQPNPVSRPLARQSGRIQNFLNILNADACGPVAFRKLRISGNFFVFAPSRPGTSSPKIADLILHEPLPRFPAVFPSPANSLEINLSFMAFHVNQLDFAYYWLFPAFSDRNPICGNV
jgi:hypothetical protein